MRWVGWAVLLLAAGCVFAPDLSRFPRCDAGLCPAGSTCLVEEGVCLPDCGGGAVCTPDPASTPDAGDGTDGGTDAGGTDGGSTDGGSTEPLGLMAEGLQDGLETSGYEHHFQARGGSAPYTFTLVDGMLPPGLLLSAQGVLSSKPTQAGTYTFTLEVADAAGGHARQDFSLSVRALLRLAGPGALADFPMAKAYTEQLSATGGTPPYHFALLSGTPLPAGLVLHDTGLVDGMSSGSASAFQVQVTDSADPVQSDTRTLQLTPSSCSVSVTCLRTRTVPDGRVGQFYSYAFQSSNTTSSATWTVDTGSSPPPGLSLEPTTGVLSGTPTQAGSTSFSVTLTNVVDKKSTTLTLRVF